MKKNNRKRVLVRGKRTNAEKKMINITRLSQKTNEEKTVFARTIYPVLSNLDIEVLATEAVMLLDIFAMFPPDGSFIKDGFLKITFDGKPDNIKSRIEQLKNFCSDVFPSSNIDEKSASNGTFIAYFKKKKKKEHIKFCKGKLSIKMNESFDMSELFGLDITQIQSVKITLPIICSEKLKRKTHLIRSCLWGETASGELNVSEITIISKSSEVFVDMLDMERKLPFPIAIFGSHPDKNIHISKSHLLNQSSLESEIS